MTLLLIVIEAGAMGACASQAEQKAAFDAWGDCIERAVRRLDDGRTDPVSLAVGIAPNCADLYNDFSNVMMRGQITQRAQAVMRQDVKDNEIKLVTSAILAHRARR